MQASEDTKKPRDLAQRRLGRLTQLLQDEGLAANQGQAIERRKNPLEYPLSSGQQRLWFLQQLEGGWHYNDHFNLRLTGALNVPALERTLGEILARHEAMRAAFTEIDGRPVQRINPLAKFALPIVDLRDLGPESRSTEAIRLA